MLAKALARSVQSRGKTSVALSRPELDITKPSAVTDTFARYRPSLVLNCAAYTKVDKCDEEPELANTVNGHAVGTLAAQCREYKATLVHFSTDFVFDGRGDRPYRPDDPVNPQSAYGRSKLLGEQL